MDMGGMNKTYSMHNGKTSQKVSMMQGPENDYVY